MHVCRTDELTPFLCILINHVRMYQHVSFERTCTDYYFVFLISMSKRCADNNNLPQSKHRLTGFNPEWGSNFLFVLHTEDASGTGGVFYSTVVLLRQSSEEALCNFQKVQSAQKLL